MARDELLRDEQLRRLYERTRGPVAYVDESYRLPTVDRVGYYTMTGVLVDREDLDDYRREILKEGRSTGGKPWHTTEAYDQGRTEQIHTMVDLVARRSEWSILTIEVPIDEPGGRGERAARAACLERLMIELTRGPEPPRLVVADTRTVDGDREDQRTVALLRGRGDIPQHTMLRHSTDALEPMLCAPDTISWATRRLLVVDEPHWVQAAADCMTLIHARTGEHIDLDELAQTHNNPEQAAAIPGSPGSSARERAERPELLPPTVSHSEQTASRTIPIDQLAARVRALQERAETTATRREEQHRRPPPTEQTQNHEQAQDHHEIGDR